MSKKRRIPNVGGIWFYWFVPGALFAPSPVSLGSLAATVQLWVRRAGSKPLDQVNWEDSSHAPHQSPKETPYPLQKRVLALRKQRKERALGEFCASAIRTVLVEEGLEYVPSLATINRILRREGAFDARTRRTQTASPQRLVSS